MTGEFDLIERYIAGHAGSRDDVALGIGDDCALLQVPAGMQLAVSLDTLVCGRHFVADVDPEALGHKALAVNLSDLAAMGAEPAWATLALTLPNADEAWLSAFMRGFSGLAETCRVQLVGGDTTRGPLSITVQIHGLVEPGRALRRDGASAGDLVYVSGQLGDAGLALLAQQGLYTRPGSIAALRQRLDRPTPRIELGLALREHASAAIDVSDGLGADLGHICQRSGVAAQLFQNQLPVSAAVRDYIDQSGDWALPLTAGDDYELAFCVPEQHQAAFEQASSSWDVPVTWVGIIERGSGVRVMLPDGSLEQIANGFDHFISG